MPQAPLSGLRLEIKAWIPIPRANRDRRSARQFAARRQILSHPRCLNPEGIASLSPALDRSGVKGAVLRWENVGE